jgi:anti-anti-sigma factor
MSKEVKLEVMTMEMIESKEDGRIRLKLSGFLDTTSAGDVQKRIEALSEEAPDNGGLNLEIDLDEVEFVSSAGLRVLFLATKTAKRQQGTVIVTHVSDSIQEVLDMTGFTTILDIR